MGWFTFVRAETPLFPHLTKSPRKARASVAPRCSSERAREGTATMINILRTLSRQIGFADVDEAEDGASALEQMRRKGYIC